MKAWVTSVSWPSCRPCLATIIARSLTQTSRTSLMHMYQPHWNGYLTFPRHFEFGRHLASSPSKWPLGQRCDFYLWSWFWWTFWTWWTFVYSMTVNMCAVQTPCFVFRPFPTKCKVEKLTLNQKTIGGNHFENLLYWRYLELLSHHSLSLRLGYFEKQLVNDLKYIKWWWGVPKHFASNINFIKLYLINRKRIICLHLI